MDSTVTSVASRPDAQRSQYNPGGNLATRLLSDSIRRSLAFSTTGNHRPGAVRDVGFEAAGQHVGLVRGCGPQGMTSPFADRHLLDIEANLAQITAASPTTGIRSVG